jgi:hypothetical protein
MSTIATLTFESGQTNGSEVVLTAPWSKFGNAPIASTAAAMDGTLGCRWTDTSTNGRIMYDTGLNQTGPLVLGFKFKINTFSTANHYIGSMLSLTSGGTPQGDWRINPTSHTVTIRNGTTAVATSDANAGETISSGTEYWAEWMVDPSSDEQRLRIYEGDETDPTIELAGGWGSEQTRVAAFGPNIAATGGAIDYDTITIANDWIRFVDVPVSAVATVGSGMVLIDATSSTGNTPLTYAIAPKSGDTGTQTEIGPGQWLVPIPTDANAVYTVTVSDSGGSDQTDVTVNQQSSGGSIRYWDGTNIITL